MNQFHDTQDLSKMKRQRRLSQNVTKDNKIRDDQTILKDLEYHFDKYILQYIQLVTITESTVGIRSPIKKPTRPIE